MSPTEALPTPVTRFALPPGAEADGPPERRGVARDGVRLLVARAGSGRVEHRRFRDLPDLLDPGDLVVVNTSATLAAAFAARPDGDGPVPVHVSTELDDGTWVVEVRRPDGTGPDHNRSAGERLRLPGDHTLTLQTGYPDRGAPVTRLWQAQVEPVVPLARLAATYGRPIGYGHLAGRYPLADHQTVYATEPGSAEMPSAGRPFTERLLVRLLARGVTVAPVVLHTGVSSLEAPEPPLPERFVVPPSTARLVDGARAAGRRVVAVGTTAVRALETVADSTGRVSPGAGWTDLVLGPDRKARAVTGLITGLHAPAASHLLLVEAVAGPELVAAAYGAAVERGYLWHEFGDSSLFLPQG